MKTHRLERNFIFILAMLILMAQPAGAQEQEAIPLPDAIANEMVEVWSVSGLSENGEFVDPLVEIDLLGLSKEILLSIPAGSWLDMPDDKYCDLVFLGTEDGAPMHLRGSKVFKVRAFCLMPTSAVKRPTTSDEPLREAPANPANWHSNSDPMIQCVVDRAVELGPTAAAEVAVWMAYMDLEYEQIALITNTTAPQEEVSAYIEPCRGSQPEHTDVPPPPDEPATEEPPDPPLPDTACPVYMTKAAARYEDPTRGVENPIPHASLKPGYEVWVLGKTKLPGQNVTWVCVYREDRLRIAAFVLADFTDLTAEELAMVPDIEISGCAPNQEPVSFPSRGPCPEELCPPPGGGVPPAPADAPVYQANQTPGGSPITGEVQGVSLVYVPEGCFMMGSEASSMESPVHEVCLSDFWIGETEVTNDHYRCCVSGGGCSYTPASNAYNEPEYSNHPVVGVSWNGAVEYAQWLGGRLPTEAEWEYAARGPVGHQYPWGDTIQPNCSLANFAGCVKDTKPVGSYPQGASWVGALDMAGNVREWVYDWYGRYLPGKQQDPINNQPNPDDQRVLRGGSYKTVEWDMRGAARGQYDMDSYDLGFGFRVAFPAE